MSKSQAGGASTIGGVVYQLLWTLLEVTEFEVSNFEVSNFEVSNFEAESGGPRGKATLIVEPAGGGGDARYLGENAYVVTQVKSRSEGKTWSLKEVITGVLPDLMKGIRMDAPEPKYQFVTNGRIGNWTEVQDFFSSLRGLSASGIEGVLQVSKPLKVGGIVARSKTGAKSFWSQTAYTHRDLVVKITNEIQRTCPAGSVTYSQEEVLHLLAHFEFCDPLDETEAKTRIDAALSEVVDRIEDVGKVRLALLQRLAELAKQGDASIRLGDFLKSEGITSIPTGNAKELLRRNSEVIETRIRALGFRLENHVQEQLTEELVATSLASSVTLVVGRSGAGKSWHCCAVARSLVCRGHFVAHVDAATSASKTLDNAMAVFWNDVKGNDASLPANRVAQRFPGPPPQRVLIVDRVETVGLARDLIVASSSLKGVRLVLGCSKRAAEAAHAASGGHIPEVQARAFSARELIAYLNIRGKTAWEAIPVDMRLLLTTPLFASLYCSDGAGQCWNPTSEYDLLDGYWETRFTDGGAEPDMDAPLLSELAASVVAQGGYPWSAECVYSVLKHAESLTRLKSSGILYGNKDGSCEIQHDRLFNWLISKVLARGLSDGSRTAEATGLICADASSGHFRPGGRMLGYVPMDTMWHLGSQGEGHVGADLLVELEKTSMRTALYSELVPTLGVRVSSALICRLDRLLAGKPSYLLSEVANCLSLICIPEVLDKARELLGKNGSAEQAAALVILTQQPDPASLDRMWEVHTDVEGDQLSSVEYEKRMEAMKSAIRSDPRWLTSRLQRAEKGTSHVTDLVYLLAGWKEGAECWIQLKEHLKEIVPPTKSRSLIRCITVFEDLDEIEFLEARAHRSDDWSGDMALGALARLDPVVAASTLGASDLKALIWTRGWHFLPLLAARPTQAQEAVRELSQRRGDPSALSQMYLGVENEIDAASFDLVLNDLERTLAAEVSTGKLAGNGGDSVTTLKFIDQVVGPELLDKLSEREGGGLADLLGKYLLLHAPRASSFTERNRELAFRALEKIGSPVLLEWMKLCLRDVSRYARFDALMEVHKHYDPEVLALVRHIAKGTEEDSDGFESQLAMQGLARIGEWETVLQVALGIGLSRSWHLIEERWGMPPLQGEFVESLLIRAATEGMTEADLLVAGLSGDNRFLEHVERVAKINDLSENGLLAATIALGILGSSDDEASARLARELSKANAPDRLPGLVLQLKTPSALLAIEEYLHLHFDCALCAGLAGNPGWEGRAAALAWEHRGVAKRSLAFGLILPLMEAGGGGEARVYIEELALGHAGPHLSHSVRTEAIRLWGRWDAARAFEAALGLLKQPSEGYGSDLARLLVELDSDSAAPKLVELLCRGGSEGLELAISESLSGIRMPKQVKSLLHSTDSGERRAACLIIGQRADAKKWSRDLRSRAIDIEGAVAMAARQALREDLRASGIRHLSERVLTSSGQERAILLDQIFSAARASKDRSCVRSDALAPLQGELTPFEARAWDDSKRNGEREFQSGARQRARKRKASRGQSL